MSESEIREAVLAMFRQHFSAALEQGEDAYFADTGVLDSFATVELITQVEQNFGLHVPDEEITEEHFGSIRNVVSYVAKAKER